MPDLPTIVNATQLYTVFDKGYTVHRFKQRNNLEVKTRKEWWKSERRLGSGSYGTVYLQKCVKGHQDVEVRAVKAVPIAGTTINWVRELETIMEFSHYTVGLKTPDYFFTMEVKTLLIYAINR